MPGTRNILIVYIPVTLPSKLTVKFVITMTITITNSLKSLARTSKIENKKKEEGHIHKILDFSGFFCWPDLLAAAAALTFEVSADRQ